MGTESVKWEEVAPVVEQSLWPGAAPTATTSTLWTTDENRV